MKFTIISSVIFGVHFGTILSQRNKTESDIKSIVFQSDNKALVYITPGKIISSIKLYSAISESHPVPISDLSKSIIEPKNYFELKKEYSDLKDRIKETRILREKAEKKRQKKTIDSKLIQMEGELEILKEKLLSGIITIDLSNDENIEDGRLYSFFFSFDHPKNSECYSERFGRKDGKLYHEVLINSEYKRRTKSWMLYGIVTLIGLVLIGGIIKAMKMY